MQDLSLTSLKKDSEILFFADSVLKYQKLKIFLPFDNQGSICIHIIKRKYSGVPPKFRTLGLVYPKEMDSAVTYFLKVGASFLSGAATATNLNKENNENRRFSYFSLKQIRWIALNFSV